MSLEDALKANTEALVAHTAALEAHTKAVNRNTNTLLEAKSAKPTAEAPAADKADAPAAGKTEAAPKADAKKAEVKKGPSREDVVKALKDHAAINGKESSIAILKDLGADSVSDLDPDKYQAAIDKAAE
jgi:hypothetical protein